MRKMIFESELKVMEILWNIGDTTAKDLAIKLNQSAAWNTTTTYTVVRRCIDKGLIEKGNKFMCRALITREEAQRTESEILINKMFGGSANLLLEHLLGSHWYKILK